MGENLAQLNFVLHDGSSLEDEIAAIGRLREILALFPNVEAELAHPSVLSVRPPLAPCLWRRASGEVT